MKANEQAEAIKDRIAPMLAYLHRLKARDFLPNDPLPLASRCTRSGSSCRARALGDVLVDMPTLGTWMVAFRFNK
jgi:hypothetical protein